MDGKSIVGHVINDNTSIIVTVQTEQYDLLLHPPWARDAGANNGDDRITSPMPGVVTQVLVDEGASIRKGQPLIRVEAMKMIHTIVAKRDGLIQAVHFAEGSSVEENSTLISLANQDS